MLSSLRFVCQTSEDAIVIAATLYKSLVAHMKVKERRPRNKNGVTSCMSITSSLNNDTKNSSMPVRPPRKKRSSTSSIISESEVMSVSIAYLHSSLGTSSNRNIQRSRFCSFILLFSAIFLTRFQSSLLSSNVLEIFAFYVFFGLFFFSFLVTSFISFLTFYLPLFALYLAKLH